MRRGGLGIIAIVLIAVGGGIAAWNWSTSSSETPTAASFGFGDWLVQCQTVEGKVGCGMSQKILNQGGGQAVLQLHLGRAPSGTGKSLVVVVPLGVTVANGVALEVGDLKKAIAFTQCLPGGCVAPTAADAALIEKMKTSSAARVGVVDRTGAPVSIPFSLKGFAPAYEKMEAQGGLATGSWLPGFGEPADK